MNGVKVAAIAAGITLVAVGAAAPFTDLPVRGIGGVPDVMSMLHKRSPEQRPEGALASAKGRVSAVLPAAVAPAAPPVRMRVQDTRGAVVANVIEVRADPRPAAF